MKKSNRQQRCQEYALNIKSTKNEKRNMTHVIGLPATQQYNILKLFWLASQRSDAFFP